MLLSFTCFTKAFLYWFSTVRLWITSIRFPKTEHYPTATWFCFSHFTSLVLRLCKTVHDLLNTYTLLLCQYDAWNICSVLKYKLYSIRHTQHHEAHDPLNLLKHVHDPWNIVHSTLCLSFNMLHALVGHLFMFYILSDMSFQPSNLMVKDVLQTPDVLLSICLIGCHANHCANGLICALFMLVFFTQS